MTTTYTTNLTLALQGVGDNQNTWGIVLNSSVFTLLDQILGSTTTISTTGGTTTLTTTQAQFLYFTVSGALVSNATLAFPASAGRLVFVNNTTSGAFTLTVQPTGGTGIIVPSGTKMAIAIDAAGTATNAANTPINIEASLASASTTDLGSTGSNLVKITGTTTITSFGSSAIVANAIYFVKFAGALTLTYNSTSLKLPGSANITTAADDFAVLQYLGSGNWRCVSYSAATGIPTGIAGVYAPLASPTFTGTSTFTGPAIVPTLAAGTNSLQAIGAAYVLSGLLAGVQFLTASGTYTPTTGTSKALVICIGAGGGSGGSGSSGGGTGGTGGTTSFGSLCAASGGVGGRAGTVNGTAGGAGGAGTIGDFLLSGSGGGSTQGTSSSSLYSNSGGSGGVSFLGGAALQSAFATNGNSSGANTGSGGSGASCAAGITFPGSGGGAGGLAIAFISNATTQTVTIGAGGTAGTAGTSGSVGGAGGSGSIIVLEFK